MLTFSARAEAKIAEAKFYYTGKPCKHGHISARRTRDGMCILCERQKRKRYVENHYDKVKTFKALKYASDPVHREHLLAKNRQWRQQNAGSRSHTQHLRTQRVKQATPAWASLEEIKQTYEHRDYISRLTGTVHHVDHIVPLNNKLVCGLHVPWNLQIISAKENNVKYNSFGVDTNAG